MLNIYCRSWINGTKIMAFDDCVVEIKIVIYVN